MPNDPQSEKSNIQCSKVPISGSGLEIQNIGVNFTDASTLSEDN